MQRQTQRTRDVQVRTDDGPTEEEILACMPATGDLDLEAGLPQRVADALVHALCTHEELWGTVDLRLARALLAEQLEAAAAGIVDLGALYGYLSAGPDTQMAAARCCALLKEQMEPLGFVVIMPNDVERWTKPQHQRVARKAAGTAARADDGPGVVVVCAPIFAAIACLAVLFGLAT